jgi:hypothetical protein
MDRNGDEVVPIYIFAKNQKDLKQLLKILKNNNDKGTLKIIKRMPCKLYRNYESWEEVYSKECLLLQGIINAENN